MFEEGQFEICEHCGHEHDSDEHAWSGVFEKLTDMESENNKKIDGNSKRTKDIEGN